MKKTCFSLSGIIGGLMVMVASCASDLDTSRVPMSSASSGKNRSLIEQLDRSLGDWRRAQGLEVITRSEALDRLAQAHSEFMALNRGRFNGGTSNVSHYGFEERALLAQRRYGMQNLAENVAAGPLNGDIPAKLTHGWVNSAKHRYNLSQDWDVAGLGVHVTDDGMVFATQIFGTLGHSSMGMRSGFRQF